MGFETYDTGLNKLIESQMLPLLKQLVTAQAKILEQLEQIRRELAYQTQQAERRRP